MFAKVKEFDLEKSVLTCRGLRFTKDEKGLQKENKACGEVLDIGNSAISCPKSCRPKSCNGLVNAGLVKGWKSKGQLKQLVCDTHAGSRIARILHHS